MTITPAAPAAPQATTESTLEELAEDECRTLLSLASVGRVAFVDDALPMILPVNYRWLDDDSGRWILIRTREGNAIDRAPDQVAFEIDGTDHTTLQGWSVVVRGVLRHLDHNDVELLHRRFDPAPWAPGDRTSWLAIKPTLVTGRRLRAGDPGWAFKADAYL